MINPDYGSPGPASQFVLSGGQYVSRSLNHQDRAKGDL